jgi:hypothetical protein
MQQQGAAIVCAEAMPVAEAVAVPVKAGWLPEYYMADWGPEKRHRFEQLAAELEWDTASIQEAAHVLAGANVVVIADDSGSMGHSVRNSPVPPPPGQHVTSRWDELMHFLSLVLRIGAELAGRVHFHFLNGGVISDVQVWEQVEHIARRGPSGRTPLLAAMRQVFEQYDPAKTECRLVTIIATDGVPSDGPTAGVAVALKQRPSVDKSFVTFLSCTDNDRDVAYIKELDAGLPHVDEVDDYYTERAEVARAGGRSVYKNFSVGDWALRAVVGAAVPAWDKSDEPATRGKATRGVACCAGKAAESFPARR